MLLLLLIGTVHEGKLTKRDDGWIERGPVGEVVAVTGLIVSVLRLGLLLLLRQMSGGLILLLLLWESHKLLLLLLQLLAPVSLPGLLRLLLLCIVR